MATTQNASVLIDDDDDDDDGAAVVKSKALNSMPAAAAAAALQQQSKIEKTNVTCAPSSEDEFADNIWRYPQCLLRVEDLPCLSSSSMPEEEDETPSMISDDEPLNVPEERFLVLPMIFADLHPTSSQDLATAEETLTPSDAGGTALRQLKAVPRVERKRRLLKAVPRVVRKRRLPL